MMLSRSPRSDRLSIAAGSGVDPAESFPGVLQQRIQEKQLPWEIVNAGVSGDTTAGGLRRMPWLLKRRMDVLVIELGGNDGLRGLAPEETRANLEKIINLAREKYPDVRIILAGMQMPHPNAREVSRLTGHTPISARAPISVKIPVTMRMAVYSAMARRFSAPTFPA